MLSDSPCKAAGSHGLAVCVDDDERVKWIPSPNPSQDRIRCATAGRKFVKMQRESHPPARGRKRGATATPPPAVAQGD